MQAILETTNFCTDADMPLTGIGQAEESKTSIDATGCLFYKLISKLNLDDEAEDAVFVGDFKADVDVRLQW